MEPERSTYTPALGAADKLEKMLGASLNNHNCQTVDSGIVVEQLDSPIGNVVLHSRFVESLGPAVAEVDDYRPDFDLVNDLSMSMYCAGFDNDRSLRFDFDAHFDFGHESRANGMVSVYDDYKNLVDTRHD